MSEDLQNADGESPEDIVFDCPNCGKNLAIDSRGAGLEIVCPDCNAPVMVPGLPLEERELAEEEREEEEVEQPDIFDMLPKEPEARIEALEEALEGSHAKIIRLVESLEGVRERRRYLEKLRSDNMARSQLIAKDLATIQNAMDRIVALLQDAAAEQGMDEG